jgi:hypothetical protein
MKELIKDYLRDVFTFRYPMVSLLFFLSVVLFAIPFIRVIFFADAH